MKTLDMEFSSHMPSLNELRKMHHFAYRRLVRGFRELILITHHEGPWPKFDLDKSLPKDVRAQIKARVKAQWAKPRRVAAEIVVRRVRRMDSDNNDGGLKPLWDAFDRAGWMVNDHLRWLKKVKIEQVLGDEPKANVRLYVPENDEDDKKIEAMPYVIRER
ncbi:MAG: hypothetical protein KIS92_02740 [Planctomycetota bacterium]|nr:hypothetical protein [Planctomycetota bacterium]